MSCKLEPAKEAPTLRPYRVSATIDLKAVVLATDAKTLTKAAENWSVDTWEEVSGADISFLAATTCEDLLDAATVRARAKKDPEELVAFIRRDLPTHVLWPTDGKVIPVWDDLVQQHVVQQAEDMATSLALSTVQLRLPGIE